MKIVSSKAGGIVALDNEKGEKRVADAARARTPLEAVALLYHDVVSKGDFASSGFLVPGAKRYKMDHDEFERHLCAIAKTISQEPGSVLDLLKSASSEGQGGYFPFYLTFDDGGSSAWSCVAGLLERFRWKAHFLVTTNYIGSPGFLGKNEIRALRSRGHIIGSHSASHPNRMSACRWQKMIDEWAASVETLSEVLGEPVRVASVPGGYYSKRVAEAAATVGIKVLFNSEPTTKCRCVKGCLVLGRYSVQRGTSPEISARLAARHVSPRFRRWLSWSVKRVGKSLGGDSWLRMRELLLRNE